MSSPALKPTQNEQLAPKPALVPPPHQAPAGPVAADKKPSNLRRIILGLVAVVALGFAGKYGYEYLTVGRFQVSTDDSYVKADTSILSTKIGGLVTETPVNNNTAVKAGDVVLRLDAADYQSEVASATAKMATQRAALAVIAQQKLAQAAQIAAAQAQIQSAKSTELNAAQSQQRASVLVKTAAGSQQALDDATHARDTAAAGTAVAEANLNAAQAQLSVLDANAEQAKSAMNELQVSLDKANRDAASADIRAPFDGVVANRAVAPGEYVAPGTNLLALVPVSQSFIIANFKETQLADLHVGQKVDIWVDAYKGQTFEGKVASLSPASGAEFSLLPPDNATGNFTKITQRFPVKILLPEAVSLRLRPGMSVAVSVDGRDIGTDQKLAN
ncbi:MAG TPA: HlyD family secretion protein [Aestuariivirga sp.]